MKPLTQLDNIEKATLLHSLFPNEIPALLEFTLNLALTIQEDGPVDIWNNGMLHSDMSRDILAMVIETIQQDQKILEQRPKAFADNLFDGFTSLFTRYSIDQYTTVRQHENKKFVQCYQLLFEV